MSLPSQPYSGQVRRRECQSHMIGRAWGGGVSEIVAAIFRKYNLS